MGLTLSPERSLRWGRLLWLLIGFALIGYAVVFTLWVFFGGTMELGLGAEEVGATRDEIRAFRPALMHYIDHLHVALGGFMAGLGIAIVGLAWFGLQARQRWSLWVMVTAAAVALVVSTPMHHLHGFDTLVHMGAVYPGVVLGAVATWLALRGLGVREPGSGYRSDPLDA